MAHIPTFVGLKKDGVMFVPDGDGFTSTTKGPKIINGIVVCSERRYYKLDATLKDAIKKGYKPVFR